MTIHEFTKGPARYLFTTQSDGHDRNGNPYTLISLHKYDEERGRWYDITPCMAGAYKVNRRGMIRKQWYQPSDLQTWINNMPIE